MKKPLTLKQAVRLARRAIAAQIQKLAVDANLYLYYGYEGGRKFHETREQLKEADLLLRDLEESL